MEEARARVQFSPPRRVRSPPARFLVAVLAAVAAESISDGRARNRRENRIPTYLTHPVPRGLWLWRRGSLVPVVPVEWTAAVAVAAALPTAPAP